MYKEIQAICGGIDFLAGGRFRSIFGNFRTTFQSNTTKKTVKIRIGAKKTGLECQNRWCLNFSILLGPNADFLLFWIFHTHSRWWWSIRVFSESKRTFFVLFGLFWAFFRLPGKLKSGSEPKNGSRVPESVMFVFFAILLGPNANFWLSWNFHTHSRCWWSIRVF